MARALHAIGVVTSFDRAALAAYCLAYGRWVETEEKLAETPILIRTPSGYVQQSPLLGIIHKQLELMGRYMTELGMTPASRSRVAAHLPAEPEPMEVSFRIVSPERRGIEAPALDAPMDARALLAQRGVS